MFSATKGGSPSGYQISRSVRLRSSASAYFNRTLTTPTDAKKWTWSGWVKRGILGASPNLFWAWSGSGNEDQLMFSTDTLRFYVNGGTTGNIITSAVFRDPSAWYHIIAVYDSANATANDRMILYVNGVRQALSTNTQPTLNYFNQFNTAVSHSLGRNVPAATYFDGYLTEVNFIDGQALTPSSFGETNTTTGVWQPKKYTGTYGTNGFYLNFSDNSAATAAAIGKDYSGNGNNWTPNNISVTAGATYDSMLDVPTQWADGGNGRGNYAVFSPIDKGSDITLTNGNLTYTGSASAAGWRATRGTFGLTSGKWRFSISGTSGASARTNFGIARPNTDLSSYFASQNSGIQYAPYDALVYVDGASSSLGSTYQGTTNTFDVLIDVDNKKIWFAVDGTVLGSGNPDAGTNAAATWTHTDPIFPVAQCYGGTWSATFGQRPFTTTLSTSTNFKALNTLNLPTPTILKGNQFFDATTYTGTGASLNVVNSGGMQPDFVWTKPRSTAVGHTLFDSVRGVTKYLQSNTTGAEGTAATSLTAFNSDGFTVNSDTSTGANGVTYVGWQWKAGAGSSSSNNSGSITSTVSVNPTAGFSVVTYTGTGANATVGHGLGVAPRMIIVKQRTALPSAQNWIVGHQSLSATPWNSYVWLDLTSAIQTASVVWNNTAPTSSVFSIGTGNGVNVSTGTYVAYCFAAIAGYSAFGSYTGNGSADGTFVFCGFRPRYVLIKSSSAAATNWILHDTAREPYNLATASLYPNLSNAETVAASQSIDILSNGFKLRNTSGDINGSGATYIFAAFAENPFKNALAR